MKTKILLIVEGEAEEVRILGNHTYGLLKLINSDYEIVPFCNPIYELYDSYKNGEYDDIVQYLRYNKGLSIPSEKLSKNAFSAIYLIFDFEPHYHKYSDNTISDILRVFSNETENGKLYINYPMVESFYHLKSLPDYDYNDRIINLPLESGKYYKKLVNSEMAFRKNKLDKKLLELIILQNYDKALKIIDNKFLDYDLILKKQIEKKNDQNKIFILSTFPLMIIDYNSDILEEIRKNTKKNYNY